MSSRYASALLALVLGCSGDKIAASANVTSQDELISLARNEQAHSGSRLKARFLAAEGVKHFDSLVDPQLGGACEFKKDRAGTFRCMPEGSSGSIGFADAACTEPLALYYFYEDENGDRQPALDRYLTTYQFSDACETDGSTRATPYEVGEPVPAPETIYVSYQGQCQVGSAGGDPELSTFAAREVRPAELIGAQVGYRTLGVRLAQRTFFGEDGSRAPVQSSVSGDYHDLWLNRHVMAAGIREPRFRFATEYIWIGPSYGLQRRFADATCTVPAVEVGNCGVPAETFSYVDSRVNAACQRESIYQEVLQAEPEAVYDFDWWRQECALHSPPPTSSPMSYRLLGDAPSERRFLAGVAKLRGKGRIAAIDIDSWDHSRARIGLYDRTLDAECTPIVDHAGQGQCRPFKFSSFAKAYRDAACTQPIIIRNPEVGIAGDPELADCYTKPIVVVQQTAIGSDRFERLVRGAPLGTLPVFRLTPWSSCEARGEEPAWEIAQTLELAASPLAVVEE